MNLKKQAIVGTKWTAIANINNAIIQIIQLSILTRLLDKSDFGIIAIAMMVVGFTEIFSNLGFTAAIIHKQDISSNQYSSIFWINLFFNLFICLILVILSPVFVYFYKQQILLTLIPLLSLRIFFNSFGKLFFSFRTKELDFPFISKVNILGAYVGFIVTLVLAWFNYGVYSIVLGSVLSVFITQLIYAFSGMKQYKIKFYINLKEIKDFLKIGGYKVGAQTFDYISNKIDVLLIGYFFGMSNLGIYNLAKELIARPTQLINPIINNVAAPVFAKMQTNLSIIKSKYLEILKILSFINFPIYVCLALFAESFVNILYGENLIEVAVFVRILSICGLLNSVGNSGGALQVAFGRTDLGFYWTIIRLVITPIVILISSHFSLIFVAYSQVFIALIFFVLYWKYMVSLIIEVSFKEYISALKYSFLYSCISGLFFIPIVMSVDAKSDVRYVAILLFIMVYGGLLFMFRKKHNLFIKRYL